MKVFGIERRYTTVINEDIPRAIADRMESCDETIAALKRLNWRKNYELMIPVLTLSSGKSFGELAVQKEVNVKIAHKAKARQASVVCRTDCKFAVMQKADYQGVLDNIDRRKVDKLREFFK